MTSRYDSTKEQRERERERERERHTHTHIHRVPHDCACVLRVPLSMAALTFLTRATRRWPAHCGMSVEGWQREREGKKWRWA